MRHTEVTQLWLQDNISQKILSIRKVGTDDNPANALTKGVDAAAVQKHIAAGGIELRSDRHRIAPTLGINAETNMNIEDK